MENYFTKEQIKQLDYLGCKYYFEQIIGAQYKSATRLTLSKELEKIYKEATNSEEKINWSCNQCSYNFWKKCATLYYKSKEYYEKVDAEKPIITKKKGRPKKNGEENANKV